MFSKVDINLPGYFSVISANYVGNDNCNKLNYFPYSGKIVLVVNEWVQSSAECLCMAFQKYFNSITIGNATSGTDGNISYIKFPGNLTYSFSGIGVYYPDGTPTQRVGLKIDRRIFPSINAVRDGKDDFLEKAIEIIGR